MDVWVGPCNSSLATLRAKAEDFARWEEDEEEDCKL